jgi:hypothetical protein
MGYTNLWSMRMILVYHIEHIETVLEAIKEVYVEADAE